MYDKHCEIVDRQHGRYIHPEFMYIMVTVMLSVIYVFIGNKKTT